MKRQPTGVYRPDRWWVTVIDPHGISSMASNVGEETARAFIEALLDEIIARAPVDGHMSQPWQIRANLTGPPAT